AVELVDKPFCDAPVHAKGAKVLHFFFSSRRRHTRSYGDWSSDVCSSDLRIADDRFRATDQELEQQLRDTEQKLEALQSKRNDKRSEEHTSELQSPYDLVCRLLLEKKKKDKKISTIKQTRNIPRHNNSIQH